jgi:2,4-dienoyl-CoA reductase-like NADH-dependent reductase (Old Yellow Enzyme family)
MSDDELLHIRDAFVRAAHLAREAGFDAVDIKACHGYLLHELLSARMRTGSRYGGVFKNRVRLLLEIVKAIKSEVPDLLVAVRLNAYDGIPFPFGFGVEKKEGGLVPDLSEPKDLLGLLIRAGAVLFNITAGNPHYNPHVGRPFDRPLPGSPLPGEHPLEGISRLLEITAELQRSVPEFPVVGTGYSWLRQFFPMVGAGVLKNGGACMIGLGRSSFAYPEAPRVLMDKGILDTRRVCITCSRCTELMRQGSVSGCVIRDKDVYGGKHRGVLS